MRDDRRERQAPHLRQGRERLNVAGLRTGKPSINDFSSSVDFSGCWDIPEIGSSPSVGINGFVLQQGDMKPAENGSLGEQPLDGRAPDRRQLISHQRHLSRYRVLVKSAVPRPKLLDEGGLDISIQVAFPVHCNLVEATRNAIRNLAKGDSIAFPSQTNQFPDVQPGEFSLHGFRAPSLPPVAPMMPMVVKDVECRIDRPVNPPGVPGDYSIGALQSLSEGTKPRSLGPVGFNPLGSVGVDLHPPEPPECSEVPIEQRDDIGHNARADILGIDLPPAPDRPDVVRSPVSSNVSHRMPKAPRSLLHLILLIRCPARLLGLHRAPFSLSGKQGDKSSPVGRRQARHEAGEGVGVGLIPGFSATRRATSGRGRRNLSQVLTYIGRSLVWHARGQGFKSPILHSKSQVDKHSGQQLAQA